MTASASLRATTAGGPVLSASAAGAAIKSAGILTTVSPGDRASRACHFGVAGRKLVATYIVTSLTVHNRRLVSRSINGHLFILIGYKLYSELALPVLGAGYYIPIPNACIFSGAKNGRTVCAASSDLHLTTVGGHTGLGQGAGGEHFVGGGHLTSGQRGLGQGGHSPASFLHILLSMMTGCGLGMLLFSTYLLRSGTGGHSVFSIY